MIFLLTAVIYALINLTDCGDSYTAVYLVSYTIKCFVIGCANWLSQYAAYRVTLYCRGYLMSWFSKLPILLFSLSVAGLVACTSGGSSDSDSSGGDSPTDGSSFRTDCGVVVDGKLRNPVPAADGSLASVQITGPNQAIVTSGSNVFLVKFQGLRNVTGFRRDSAINVLQTLAREQAVFFQAESECTATVDGGGVGFVGQLFTASGVSYNESLIDAGLAEVATSDVCNGSLIGQCYSALQDSGEQLGGAISNFLWKPEAERDGRLVVLLNPGGATVVANGETLAPSGASNGRGTTARGNRSGCGFGTNVVVRAFDRQNRILLFPGGARELIIANGCNRVEF